MDAIRNSINAMFNKKQATPTPVKTVRKVRVIHVKPIMQEFTGVMQEFTGGMYDFKAAIKYNNPELDMSRPIIERPRNPEPISSPPLKKEVADMSAISFQFKRSNSDISDEGSL